MVSLLLEPFFSEADVVSALKLVALHAGEQDDAAGQPHTGHCDMD